MLLELWRRSLFLARSTVGLLGIGRICTQLSRNSEFIPWLGRGQSTWNSSGRTQIPSPERSQDGIKAPTSSCWDSLDSESLKILELLCQLWNLRMDAAFGLGIEGNPGKPSWEGAAESGFWTKHSQGDEPDSEFSGGFFFFFLTAPGILGWAAGIPPGCLQEFGKARIASSASGSEDPSPC